MEASPGPRSTGRGCPLLPSDLAYAAQGSAYPSTLSRCRVHFSVVALDAAFAAIFAPTAMLPPFLPASLLLLSAIWHNA